MREALGPAGKIRIDVNGAWDLETATETLLKLVRSTTLNTSSSRSAPWRR